MKLLKPYVSVVFAVLACAPFVACGKGESAGGKGEARGTGSVAQQVEATEPVGVPECDDYLAKYDRCISEKLSDASAQPKRSADMMRASWRQAAADPEARTGLAETCRVALKEAKISMKAYSCSW
jgi:hypothetical protein